MTLKIRVENRERLNMSIQITYYFGTKYFDKEEKYSNSRFDKALLI